MSLDNDERRPLTNAERQQRFRAQRNVLAASVDLKLTYRACINLSVTLNIISVKRRLFTEGDDETNSSLHTNIAHATVHSSVSVWDTAQSVAV